MNEKVVTTSPEERIELNADLLRDVASLLPMNTKEEIAFAMLDVYESNGYKDEYENDFFVSSTYICGHFQSIRNEAATGNDGVFIEYIWPNRRWEKVNKKDFIKAKTSQAKGIAKRIENYTYNVEVANKRWQLQLPGFEIKQLPG